MVLRCTSRWLSWRVLRNFGTWKNWRFGETFRAIESKNRWSSSSKNSFLVSNRWILYQLKTN